MSDNELVTCTMTKREQRMIADCLTICAVIADEQGGTSKEYMALWARFQPDTIEAS